ncbi:MULTISPECIES: VOC family protein [unclassified Streptomyces]|uniref:VOC family protein n=1 Tax=unclassified Streptomyces TaxID=2593676 RepID=UPI002930AA28|nr:VOC family protein [Streptomyces sp. ST1015]
MARHDWWGVVLEAPDPHGLARFYSELLGWPSVKEDDDGAAVAPPEGVACLGFQRACGPTRGAGSRVAAAGQRPCPARPRRPGLRWLDAARGDHLRPARLCGHLA